MYFNRTRVQISAEESTTGEKGTNLHGSSKQFEHRIWRKDGMKYMAKVAGFCMKTSANYVKDRSMASVWKWMRVKKQTHTNTQILCNIQAAHITVRNLLYLDTRVNLPKIPNFIQNCGGSACWSEGARGLAPLIITGDKNMRPPLRKLAHKTLWVYVCVVKRGRGGDILQMRLMPRSYPLKPAFQING